MTDAAELVFRHVWPALVAGVVLGLAVGWFGRAETRMGRGAWASFVVAVAALAALGTVVARELVPGRGGLWLEFGLAISAVSLLACLAGGSAAAALRRGRPAASPATNTPPPA